MASLSDTERWENIRGSIEKYAKAALVTAESLAVDLYDGAKFDALAVNEWLEVRYLPLPPVQSFRRVNSSGDRGEDARVLIQINVKVKVASVTNVRRAEELLDIVHKHFKQGTGIPVYQLQSGGNAATQVATLFVMDALQQDLGAKKDDSAHGAMVQWRVYEATARWDKVLAA